MTFALRFGQLQFSCDGVPICGTYGDLNPCYEDSMVSYLEM